MIVRDINGKINIISRKTCKNDSVYYEKLYNTRILYAKKYKSIVVNDNCNNINNIHNKNNQNPKDKSILKLNHLSDD